MCTITIKRDKGRKERNNLEENKRTNIPVFAEVLLIRRDRWLNLSRPKARLYGGIKGVVREVEREETGRRGESTEATESKVKKQNYKIN